MPVVLSKFAKNIHVIKGDGSITNIKNINANDMIKGVNGSVYVLNVKYSNEYHNMYKISTNSGYWYTSGDSFITLIIVKNHGFITIRNIRHYNKDIINITVEDYLNLPKTIKKHLYVYKGCIDFGYTNIPINSYLVGLWLSNSHNDDTYFSIKLPDPSLEKQLLDGYIYTRVNDMYHIVPPVNIFRTKRILNIYMRNNKFIRNQLLAGIIDSIGTIKNNHYKITLETNGLLYDIMTLCDTLGHVYIKRNKTLYIIGNIPCYITRLPIINTPIKVSTFKVRKKGNQTCYSVEIDEYDTRILLSDFTIICTCVTLND